MNSKELMELVNKLEELEEELDIYEQEKDDRKYYEVAWWTVKLLFKLVILLIALQHIIMCN